MAGETGPSTRDWIQQAMRDLESAKFRDDCGSPDATVAWLEKAKESIDRAAQAAGN